MSSLLDHTTRALGRAAGSSPLTTGVAIVLIVLVLVLLIEREVARPLLSGAQARRLGRLGFLLAPLALMLVAVIAARTGHLLKQ